MPVKISEFFFEEAQRWESWEYWFKYRVVPRITRLFGQFFDIRKRPKVFTKTTLQLLREHIREHLDYEIPYSDKQLSAWFNEATLNIAFKHAKKLARTQFGDD